MVKTCFFSPLVFVLICGKHSSIKLVLINYLLKMFVRLRSLSLDVRCARRELYYLI
jgi:hypothetical protein